MALRPTMRPRFRIPLAGEGQPVLDRLRHRLQQEDAGLVGQVLVGHAYLRLPPERQTLLSPHLNLSLEVEAGRTFLTGRFSPRPNVWTGFMAVYAVLGMVGLSGLILGWSQWAVHETPWGFWLMPAAAALVAFVYGAAVIGQGLTADEMHELRCAVDRAVAGVEVDDAVTRVPGA